MKRTIKLELDIPDVYIKTWSQNIIQSTHNYDEAINVLKENTFEKALAEDVVEYILNYYGSNFKVNYKILNPEWKPSEEEINALEHFVRSIGESGFASPYDNNTKCVYSLLSKLKKTLVRRNIFNFPSK